MSVEVASDVWEWFAKHTDYDHARGREDCTHCQEMIRAFGPMPSIQQLRAMHTQWQSQWWESKRKAFISDTLRWTVWERDNFTCQHCGSRRFLTIDHIIPKSKGGLPALHNLQTLCRRCNSAKGDR